MYFCTGSDERKAKNLKRNPHCILTTGRNTLDESLDVVVEGQVAKVSDEAELKQVANTYESKYGTHLTAPEDTWFGLGDTIRRGELLVYRVTPTTVLGFARGKQFSFVPEALPRRTAKCRGGDAPVMHGPRCRCQQRQRIEGTAFLQS